MKWLDKLYLIFCVKVSCKLKRTIRKTRMRKAMIKVIASVLENPNRTEIYSPSPCLPWSFADMLQLCQDLDIPIKRELKYSIHLDRENYDTRYNALQQR